MSDKNTILCRCENLTLGELHEMLDRGITSMEEIKRESRATMGPCQGRTCKDLIAKEIARYLGKDIEEIDIPINRAPVKPMKLGAIAGGEDNA
ncbi:BFD-like [2Fe-2S] binding domain-containing protein [Dethiosulfatibacter aminovorans DSM 17477]|uniref:BFD-like [2Fe-2S] binding domain-containing protein n=1 Tax=Dethiosulfatibacter aminovorans DSM 17477 TaxID=1121476 RepID=A0A1M6KA50_9FIRM|nr:(2Fe-2S)-binding protein [Dethiosulfatibacter aminovorans]SHJ55727.1 BFD-like [2Fe-2S] binding domain-containing protein [Dethiosulfatibacter aminovorans DSM 17477]